MPGTAASFIIESNNVLLQTTFAKTTNKAKSCFWKVRIYLIHETFFQNSLRN